MNLQSLACLFASVACLGCDRSPSKPDPQDVVLIALPEPDPPPQVRPGMLWIPPGGFIAGTPVDQYPRMPDVEPPGVEVVLHGFYIDQYPVPNEVGAIQTTGFTWDQAREKCEEQDKRLCTELEWERACKGPRNAPYGYGSIYRSSECPSGSPGILSPTGSRTGCRSGFGVFDMHGGAGEWTASSWQRGDGSRLMVVKGGGGDPGEVFGRCANAIARKPDTKRGDLGFRCCAGTANDAEVVVQLQLPEDPLIAIAKPAALSDALEQAVPDDLLSSDPKRTFRIDRVWRWYPVANEEIVLGAGCSHPSARARCGLLATRMLQDAPSRLAFASSGWWVTTFKVDDDRRTIWVYGVDDGGQFYRRVNYRWGGVTVGPVQRGEPKRRKRDQ